MALLSLLNPPWPIQHGRYQVGMWGTHPLWDPTISGEAGSFAPMHVKKLEGVLFSSTRKLPDSCFLLKD